MRYRFNEFEFDSESLLLTNNGEALAIRHTEAKVLSLLLEQVDTVLNKEDILSDVWQNKIVSEQVVFQNISKQITFLCSKFNFVKHNSIYFR